MYTTYYMRYYNGITYKLDAATLNKAKKEVNKKLAKIKNKKQAIECGSVTIYANDFDHPVAERLFGYSLSSFGWCQWWSLK